ncbi:MULTISPECIES: methionyl-tRNA formyltransferase [unclassified Variovorax]|uniref:methionyl-tRNA formyltransferase n=1 Tax=unclassified Variovorax TaxID=663243 RepID=UPI00076CC544|nr:MULTISPECIES: methionyl-tRNA formyltransferase [unclassified Variovorax]KWT85673.1 Methionyl-tRNA formyltransferase [Variovorax sp. WDL1]PNG58302.1 Methionyl-tRNA formyltransferase [Variovorax sp. B4]PNG61908.1 Methionyl-tRNA formyltransferase [Variovorax sp. B2]VTV12014.1 Methionyl-tRNA formyltransferase [Variovorax sp. WDL1]
MRIAFAGTPEFARVALEAIAAAGFEIVLVLTQPDRPAGRGMKLQASPVKQFAAARGWPVAQPRSLRLDGKYPEDAAAARAAILDARLDAMVVAAYGLILPQWVLDAPRLGCLNIHASLLPRWRGAAPIHRAIEAGDAQTGVTIMQMDAGLDTGDMLLRESLAIGDGSTAQLHDRLAGLGGRLIVDALKQAEAGTLRPEPQPDEGVSYAHKVEKQEAQIDWRTHDAAAIVRRIRAFDPFPGASSTLDGETLKLWAAQVRLDPPGQPPGTVLAVGPAGVAVAARDAVVVLTELQRPGGKRLAVADFLRGFELKPGQVFG